MAKMQERFEKGKQQDAHDFLVYLIDNLSTALDKEAALKGSTNPGCANFIQDNFEGKNGFIMKRRDTGETWVTNQDVFVNLNVSLPQRYAPITKIVVLSEGGDGVHSTGGHETGFELLKVPISNGKKAVPLSECSREMRKPGQETRLCVCNLHFH